MLIPLISLLPPRVIGGPDTDPTLRRPEGRYEVRLCRNASRTKSHLNQKMPASRNQTMPANSLNRILRGSSIGTACFAPNQNAPNARINAIAVATILPTTVNLRRNTVHFNTPKNISAVLVRHNVGQELPAAGTGPRGRSASTPW
jgi:hypothetical protein